MANPAVITASAKAFWKIARRDKSSFTAFFENLKDIIKAKMKRKIYWTPWRALIIGR